MRAARRADIARLFETVPGGETAGGGPAAATTAARAQGPVGRRFGDLILADGLVTREQFERALAEQRRTGEKLGEVLIRLELISEEQLVHFLSRQYGIPEVAIPESILPEILRLIPNRIARKYGVVPIGRTIGSVTLAVADPTNLSALDDVAFLTGLKVVPALAAPSAIRKAIERYYEPAPASLSEVLTEVTAEAGDLEVVDEHERAQVDLAELRSSADQVPVVRLVNSILLDAIRRGASDIHVDPSEHSCCVRFRIDGILHEVMTPPKRLEAALVSRVKIMASLDIAERRLPQDGRIRLRRSGREVDFRVSVLPTIFGESVSIRILDKAALKMELGALGFDTVGFQAFEHAIRASHGMVVITGPTGAGKTTTLYSAIHALNSRERNIVTVEDPVEYEIKGVSQVQVNDEIGRSFASALRSFLRHDPDVILVGEMRDQETAQMAVRAALTGHLVLTTLHTNGAAATIPRLVDMGVPPFLVASALRLSAAQRLVRRVCPDCREPYEVDEESLTAYGHSPVGLGPVTIYRAKGCALCHFTGLKGRFALYEVLPVTPEIQGLILRSAYAGEIQEVARRQGMKTLREAGLLRVLEGATTVEEVLRVTAD